MSRSARYVFDTNTLVSAVLFEQSTPGQALGRALRLGEILVSLSTLDELAEVLQREKFAHSETSIISQLISNEFSVSVPDSR